MSVRTRHPATHHRKIKLDDDYQFNGQTSPNCRLEGTLHFGTSPNWEQTFGS